jgi:signal transduction histidine kinase
MLLLGVEVDGGRLTVGRDVTWIDDLDTQLRRMAYWLIPSGLILAALVAALANRLISHRLGLVASAAVSVIEGDLTRRAPLTGAGDNFDRLSETLNAMLDRIRDLVDSLQQVTNDIAHDLRTPLGRLRQKLELARSEIKRDTAGYERVEQAIAEADGILSTFSALLRIGQIQAGAQQAAFQTLDLATVAATVADAYALAAEDSGHRLSTDLAPQARIWGDRDLLTQLLANLIENALAHTPAGIPVHILLTRHDDRVELIVADTGPGVPEDEREKIFRRFYRLDSSRTTPGTGLGLAMVAAIAKLHGASVVAEDNAPGLRIRLVFRATR